MGVKGTRIEDFVRRQIAEEPGNSVEVAKKYGVSPQTVLNIRAEFGKKGTTLTIPNRNGYVAVRMTPEELAQLSNSGDGSLAPSLIAGTIMAGSLRSRLLKAIVENGPFESLDDLMRSIRGGSGDTFGGHEVYHILAALNSQGLVEYREHGNGAAKRIHRIIATPKAYSEAGMATQYRPVGPTGGPRREEPQHRSDRTDFRTHSPVAEGGEITRVIRKLEAVVPRQVATTSSVPPSGPAPAEATPVPAPPSWPVLEGLRQRQAEVAAAKARAAKYLEAAALLADDAEEVLRLMAKAEEAEGKGLTELEAEYLAYAEANAK